ncbi:MarR family winged helix-turn-helix transcriptional regulator [Puerhibacterium puerhi]|uniref:MarR family winged helix-turn-helix transcriptional regulator n=1 Tax=Puerhibacterium puerhi TaxID=2692623 RepID=UPI001F18F5C4|nr:MarR family transcriptional regulator [Puerhibacterium puerhi]
MDDKLRTDGTVVDPVSEDPAQWPLGRLLFAVTHRVEQEWNAYLGAWDLNHAAFPVLLHLLAGPRTQRELAAASRVREQTMSRVLARLERQGYVERADDPADRRRRSVAVTDAGREAALQAARTAPAERIVTRGLDDSQRTALRDALLAMLAADDVAGGPAGADGADGV